MNLFLCFNDKLDEGLVASAAKIDYDTNKLVPYFEDGNEAHPIVTLEEKPERIVGLGPFDNDPASKVANQLVLAPFIGS